MRISNKTIQQSSSNCAAVCSHIIPLAVLSNRTAYNTYPPSQIASASCTCCVAASRTCVDMPDGISRCEITAQCAKHAFRGGDAYRIEKRPRMPSYGLSRTRRDNRPRHASESPQKATYGRRMRLPIARSTLRHDEPCRSSCCCVSATSFGHASGLHPDALCRGCSHASRSRYAYFMRCSNRRSDRPSFGSFIRGNGRCATSSLRSDILRRLPCCFPS